MIAQLGQLLLHFSLLLAGVGVLLPITKHWWVADAAQERAICRLTLWLFAAMTGALLALVMAFIWVDSSVFSVAMHSHALKPLLYRVAAVWGHHEGSMLLLTWILAGMTVAFSLLSGCGSSLKYGTLWCQHCLLFGLLCFVIATSNPLARVIAPANGGMGLTPVLQDLALVIHPPILYLGYMGFSLPFSFALAGLYYRQIHREWSGQLLPWVRVTWGFLTLGILLGSSWAYRELGWGGFWFWDPVENSSLIPWLFGTTLLHLLLSLNPTRAHTTSHHTSSDFILPHSTRFLHAITLLSLLGFLCVILGTFLVRSGILTSVHSFAHDPARALWLLIFLGILCGAAITTYARYAAAIPISHVSARLISLDTALRVQLVLLSMMGVILLAAVFLPLAAELFTQQSILVSAPYFEGFVIPIMVPIALLATLASDFPLSYRHLLPHLRLLCVAAVIAGGLAYGYAEAITGLFLGYLWLGLWLCLTTLSVLIALIVQVAYNHPKRRLGLVGMQLGHLGLGILIIGLAWVGTQSRDTSFTLTSGESVSTEGWQIQVNQLQNHPEKNYLARTAHILITDPQNHLFFLKPEVRFYPVESQHSIEAAIQRRQLGDVYVSVGDITPQGQMTLRFYRRPGIWLVWIGGGLLSLAGLAACWRRPASRQQLLS